jgi:hypothetical protein
VPSYVLSTKYFNEAQPGPNRVLYADFKPFAPDIGCAPTYLPASPTFLGRPTAHRWSPARAPPALMRDLGCVWHVGVLVGGVGVSRRSPPAFNDIVNYMGNIPAGVASPVRISATSTVSNSSGFIPDRTGVTDPELLTYYGRALVSAELINTQVREGAWACRQCFLARVCPPLAVAATTTASVCMRAPFPLSLPLPHTLLLL